MMCMWWFLQGVGDKAFCSGGDQNVKGIGGYIGEDGIPRLNILDLHKKIREIPKPVIAMVMDMPLVEAMFYMWCAT